MRCGTDTNGFVDAYCFQHQRPDAEHSGRASRRVAFIRRGYCQEYGWSCVDGERCRGSCTYSFAGSSINLHFRDSQDDQNEFISLDSRKVTKQEIRVAGRIRSHSALADQSHRPLSDTSLTRRSTTVTELLRMNSSRFSRNTGSITTSNIFGGEMSPFQGSTLFV